MDSREAAFAVTHNRGMLRLDPENPPVWRDATTLQFGADAVCVVRDPDDWQLRMLASLHNGVPRGMWTALARSLGATDDAAESFLRGISPALAAPPKPAVPVRLDLARGLAPADVENLFLGLTASSGIRARTSTEEDPGPPDAEGEIVLLAAHDVVLPRRAAALLREDRPHLPIVFTGSGVRIGPLVVPGRTACLACLEEHRRDADRFWPIVASQLVGRSLPPGEPALALEAGIVAARLVTENAENATESVSWTLHRGGLERRRIVHVPHPGCLCRSPAGNATASAEPTPSRPTTTVRGFARRA